MSAQASATGRTRRPVVGIFDGPEPAQTAIRALRAAGFSDEEIGVVMRDLGGGGDLVRQRASGGAGDDVATGAAAGAATGGMVGGLLGLLGSLLVPGVGPIVVGGVLGSTLVGAGAGAATGGLIGGLVGMGVSADDARHFDRGFRAGGILVTVNADGAQAETAAGLMEQHGADLGPSRTAGRDVPGVGATDIQAIGDLAAADARATSTGTDRRSHADATYPGPERRTARV
jgi:hypothetical protein